MSSGPDTTVAAYVGNETTWQPSNDGLETGSDHETPPVVVTSPPPTGHGALSRPSSSFDSTNYGKIENSGRPTPGGPSRLARIGQSVLRGIKRVATCVGNWSWTKKAVVAGATITGTAGLTTAVIIAAGKGALIGSLFGPGYGSAVGAIVGAIAGWISFYGACGVFGLAGAAAGGAVGAGAGGLIAMGRWAFQAGIRRWEARWRSSGPEFTQLVEEEFNDNANSARRAIEKANQNADKNPNELANRLKGELDRIHVTLDGKPVSKDNLHEHLQDEGSRYALAALVDTGTFQTVDFAMNKCMAKNQPKMQNPAKKRPETPNPMGFDFVPNQDNDREPNAKNIKDLSNDKKLGLYYNISLEKQPSGIYRFTASSTTPLTGLNHFGADGAMKSTPYDARSSRYECEIQGTFDPSNKKNPVKLDRGYPKIALEVNDGKRKDARSVFDVHDVKVVQPHLDQTGNNDTVDSSHESSAANQRPQIPPLVTKGLASSDEDSWNVVSFDPEADALLSPDDRQMGDPPKKE